jgi:hypothetical protein
MEIFIYLNYLWKVIMVPKVQAWRSLKYEQPLQNMCIEAVFGQVPFCMAVYASITVKSRAVCNYTLVLLLQSDLTPEKSVC